MEFDYSIIGTLRQQFPETSMSTVDFQDRLPTIQVDRNDAKQILSYLKNDIERPFRAFYDLTAIDQRNRRKGKVDGEDFHVVYHLLSYDRNSDIRVMVPLNENDTKVDSITDIFPAANWYERETWDMFGIHFNHHPCLRRILMPPDWEGHPLRKEHPARATELPAYMQSDESYKKHEAALTFHPEEWGWPNDTASEDSEYMYLNLGPNHPGTHGVLRIILRLHGEEIIDVIPDIGYHHRGAEKMAERQTFHSFIPYTDRIDYLGGVNNNLAYLLAVEKLTDITVPERAQQIRVLMCEMYRIASHLVWLGTYGHDVGAMTPVFWTFKEREKIFDFVAAVTGDRMHPNWFRIGGVAQDLPESWDEMVTTICDDIEKNIGDFEVLMSKSGIFKARTQGVGAYTLDQAIEWGVTGPNLRACGMEWDFRKKRPYSGYDQYDFDVPTATNGDSYDRCVVRIEEIHQSIRIVRQIINHIEGGDYIADHPLAIPGQKARTMEDIEALIHHFLGVSWGFGYPEGGAHASIEAPKGNNGYFIVSDGGTMPYRLRIRTPSFNHMQTLPMLSQGHQIADLLTVIGSLDYVLADIDR